MGGAVVGNKKLVGEDIFGVLRNGGMSMSPFNAWVFTKGLETLSLRMQRHCQNAYELASWLEKHPAIEKVYYPGLASHPQHQLAKQQQTDFGGMVSFVVKGGKDAAWKIVNSLKMLSITANLGDTKTTITHPATTTHSRLSQEQRDAADISDGLLRLSVGLEDIRDIKNDLLRGLDH
jgi:O-succinylhomoserine sulfhydrylase